MDYPINEIFQTIQGEGYFSGTPALFIRLQGCPVGCSWCDTQHTWIVDPAAERTMNRVVHKRQANALWARLTLIDIKRLLIQAGYTARHAVITGGEPCLYNLTPLTEQLEQTGYQCQIETSGTAAIQCSPHTWVTLSPKIGMRGGLMIVAQALQRADEIKHPVARERDIQQLQSLLKQLSDEKTRVIGLQPISQQPRATQLCIQACLKYNWRLSLQLHKYCGIA
ncbi:MAG: 7-carboxy-7-deazaguanine synthase QueE [Candidatus Symbiodolus clandestinus]